MKELIKVVEGCETCLLNLEEGQMPLSSMDLPENGMVICIVVKEESYCCANDEDRAVYVQLEEYKEERQKIMLSEIPYGQFFRFMSSYGMPNRGIYMKIKGAYKDSYNTIYRIPQDSMSMTVVDVKTGIIGWNGQTEVELVDADVVENLPF